MKPERLAALADGVFAIVLTLLVLELKVPQLVGHVSDTAIWNELKAQGATWLGFILSFTFLFSIWRIHHFVMSVLAKTLDNRLTDWNGFLLFFVAVVPFTAHLLGAYSRSPLAISLYAANVILIGFAIYKIRTYIITSDHIESAHWSRRDEWSSRIRLAVPASGSLLAVAVAWTHPGFSLALFAFGILFNLTGYSVRSIYWTLGRLGVQVPPVESR